MFDSPKNRGNLGWLNLAQYGLPARYRDAEQMLGHACDRLTGPDASAPIGTPPQYLFPLCCMMKTMTHATLGEIMWPIIPAVCGGNRERKQSALRPGSPQATAVGNA